jgi:hypothetical protein
MLGETTYSIFSGPWQKNDSPVYSVPYVFETLGRKSGPMLPWSREVGDNTCEIVGVLRSDALYQVFIFMYCNLDMEARHLRLNMQNLNLIVGYRMLCW